MASSSSTALFVQMVINRYAHLVESIETLSLRYGPLSDEDVTTLQDNYAGGASFAGMPIGIQFSRPIPDLPAFCEELFSSRAPFRLWGQPAVTEDEALVEAVDLHAGQRITIEVGHDWMRVYLYAGSCGNTIARLISNLQTRFDGALALTHPDLQVAASLKPDTALAR